MDINRLRELPLRHRNEPCCTELAPRLLSASRTAELAGQLKAVANVTRLAMLDLLARQKEPICVCDITPQFDQSQPTISHHLRILREAGLVDSDKRGLWAYYWPTDLGRKLLITIETVP